MAHMARGDGIRPAVVPYAANEVAADNLEMDGGMNDGRTEMCAYERRYVEQQDQRILLGLWCCPHAVKLASLPVR
jgi:hypothetical protein